MNPHVDLALYGHPFSSYTWKAQIACAAVGAEPELRIVDPEHPEHGNFIATHAGPFGSFPVLVHAGTVIFEATTIVEYLDRLFMPEIPLLPRDPDEAIRARMIDRVFDNYVMGPMQTVVSETLRDPASPDAGRTAEARIRLGKAYDWLERWLERYPEVPGRMTLIECAAAPSLFYADWVQPIGEAAPRLKAWRAQLLALPAVSACVEAARPYRAYFPPGAPDRD